MLAPLLIVRQLPILGFPLTSHLLNKCCLQELKLRCWWLSQCMATLRYAKKVCVYIHNYMYRRLSKYRRDISIIHTYIHTYIYIHIHIYIHIVSIHSRGMKRSKVDPVDPVDSNPSLGACQDPSSSSSPADITLMG